MLISDQVSRDTRPDLLLINLTPPMSMKSLGNPEQSSLFCVQSFVDRLVSDRVNLSHRSCKQLVKFRV